MSRSQYPTSFVVSAWLATLNVVLSLVMALMTWLRHDTLLLLWAERNTTAGRTYAEGGMEALRNSPAVPSFVPLAIVSVLVFMPLVVVLMLFLRERVNWARPVLSVTLAFATLVAFESISRDLPVSFVVLAVASIAGLLALLVTLWWPSTTAWLRADDLVGELLPPEHAHR